MLTQKAKLVTQKISEVCDEGCKPMYKSVQKLTSLLFIAIFLVSCASTNVWVDAGILIGDRNIAFVGFDIKEVKTGSYSRIIDNQITDGLKIYFLKNGFKVVERNQINKIAKEMNFQMSGFTDESTIGHIGKVANADYIIFGSGIYSINGNSPFIKNLNVKMLHVESGRTVLVSTYRGTGIHLGLSIEKIGDRIDREFRKLK